MAVSPFNICSFNCKGFEYRNFDYLKKVFNKVDILLLQEHWLFEFENAEFYKLFPDCQFVFKSSMNDSSVVLGRPYGGVAMVWKRFMSLKVENITTSCGRLCAVKVSSSNTSFIIINVYMPCNNNELHNNNEFF